MLPQSFHQNCVMSPTALRDGELLSIWGDGAGVVRASFVNCRCSLPSALMLQISSLPDIAEEKNNSLVRRESDGQGIRQDLIVRRILQVEKTQAKVRLNLCGDQQPRQFV